MEKVHVDGSRVLGQELQRQGVTFQQELNITTGWDNKDRAISFNKEDEKMEVKVPKPSEKNKTHRKLKVLSSTAIKLLLEHYE